MSVYYNEIDPYAAQWLRNLIAAGHIAPGDVDERSITEVSPDDLKGYIQCHFFAGIGGWSLALRLAGWPDDRPVWTGSCPCQPLSSAGQRKGHADERHLWPAFHDLIAERKPPVVFGEQVASADGREWFAAVRADLETVGYACGAADLCAAGVGAPHIRQRLWWVADANDAALEGRVAVRQRADQRTVGPNGVVGGLGDPKGDGFQMWLDLHGQVRRQGLAEGCDVGGLADASSPRSLPSPFGSLRCGQEGAGPRDAELERLCDAGGPSPPGSHWRDADWLWCRDERWRPVESGTFPLAHGISGRVGRLRAYGNAIVPQVGAAFISACSAALTEPT